MSIARQTCDLANPPLQPTTNQHILLLEENES